jgi:hypothetical protein
MTADEFSRGDRVVVTWSVRGHKPVALHGTVETVSTQVRVRFDDPLVFGGNGHGWIDFDKVHRE